MTSKASTATTAQSESREPKLGDDVHFVHTNGTNCNAAKLTSVATVDARDYGDNVEAYELDKELALCTVMVFWPTNQPQALNSIAHSALPTSNTYHYAEECRRGC